MTREEKLKMDIRKKTFKDLMDKLEKYGKCAVIRPTGFGKTWLLAELIFKYKKVLYLYPAAVIKSTVEGRYNELIDSSLENEDDVFLDAETADTILQMQDKNNVDMMTYSMLIRLTKEDFDNMSYDLIICDECHRIGADKTKFAMGKLLNANPNAHIVGATATPSRMDSFDVINIYFNDIMTYEYNAHDAFCDGLLQRPYYCFCSYDVDKDIRNAFEEQYADYASDEKPDIDEINTVIRKAIVENKTITGMEDIIRTTCDTYAKDTSYMKFIVFFASFRHMDDKMEDVVSWFKKSYPTHNVKITKVTSQTKEFSENVNTLDKIRKRKNAIDLIFAVDMLNMGYHVNNLTGIIMYRGTKSNTIYSQQLGRVLSSGANTSGIVFDIVDNIHRSAVYNLNVNDTVTERTAANSRNSVETLELHLNEQGIVVDKFENEMPFTVKDGVVYDSKGNETNLAVTFDGKTAKIVCNSDYIPSNAKYNCNRLVKDDIKATGHEAEYRELIAKLVAEPISHRCKQVVELHFKKWCHSNGLKYPITNSEIIKFSELTKSDFKKEFAQIVKDNNYDYPIWDAQRLLSIGEAADGLVPLRLFARIKNVQVNTVLNYLDLEKPVAVETATEK